MASSVKVWITTRDWPEPWNVAVYAACDGVTEACAAGDLPAGASVAELRRLVDSFLVAYFEPELDSSPIDVLARALTNLK